MIQYQQRIEDQQNWKWLDGAGPWRRRLAAPSDVVVRAKSNEMTFFDWSDSDGMFDLFIEFIRDEMNASSGDRSREKFLAGLLVKVNEQDSWKTNLKPTRFSRTSRILSMNSSGVGESCNKN
jgi:hypothetical protein